MGDRRKGLQKNPELGRGHKRGNSWARVCKANRITALMQLVFDQLHMGHICCRTGMSAAPNTPWVCPILRDKHRCKVEQETAKI